MASTLENRQNLSSSNEQELALREADTRQLVHDLIGKNEAYFAEPDNRLDFIGSQGADSFLRIAHYANAKLRSEKPHELRGREDQKGGFLPMLHTPSHEDKPEAFKRGYEAIQEYIHTSDDSSDKKIEGVAMATEALVIWTHLFNDGNGRTGRFLAKFIEEGASDVGALVQETAQRNMRKSYYKIVYATKEGQLAVADNEDIMLEEAERDEIRKTAENFPSDVEGIYLSIKRLLENDEVRQDSAKHRPDFVKAA